MSRMPQVGEIVDEVFRVERELGQGNFGAVYRVHDLVEDRALALKVLKPGPHDEGELRRRFEREARLIYSLQHPNVLRVYYYGQTESGLPYMAMEFLEGTDLKRLVRQEGALAESRVVRIAEEVLAGLDAAHRLGIVHRDLKPANIYLVDDGGRGQVKVLDFGFAKALDDERDADLTAAKTLVGTPAYMAPELVHKAEVGPRADLYALGLIMVEMLTGEKLIQIESVYDTLMYQASKKPIKLPATLSRSRLKPVIERAVAKDLEQRYQSAAQMSAALASVMAGEPVLSQEVRAAGSDSSRGSEAIDPWADFARPGDVEPLGERARGAGSAPSLASIELRVNARRQAPEEVAEPSGEQTPRASARAAVDAELDLSAERPDQGNKREEPRTDFVLEVVLGVVLGAIVLGLALFLLAR